MIRFSGYKDPARRAAAESEGGLNDFRPYRKTTLTYAVRIPEEFEVETLEGLHTGKAGDWLAIGPAGEMYPIDAEVFSASYEPAG